ncbi:MAG: hypothetical protein EHM17_14255, partial [Verrucomicrobiaceae bacterium]
MSGSQMKTKRIIKFDTTGSWVFDLFIKDLTTGKMMAGPIPQTAWSVAWASDSRTLFYTLFNPSHRAYQLKRHHVGSDPAQDALVYHETDESYAVDVSRTRSGEFIL